VFVVFVGMMDVAGRNRRVNDDCSTCTIDGRDGRNVVIMIIIMDAVA